MDGRAHDLRGTWRFRGRLRLGVALGALGACLSQPLVRPSSGGSSVGPNAAADEASAVPAAVPVPSLDVDWEPPQQGAGRLGRLRRVLGHGSSMTLWVAPRLRGATWASQLGQAVTELGGSPVTELPEDPLLDGLLAGWIDGPMLDDRAPATLAAESLRHLRAHGHGANMLVVVDQIDHAKFDDDVVVAVHGSCAPVLKILARAQEQALVAFEPWLDEADHRLSSLYHQRLRSWWPAREQRRDRSYVSGRSGISVDPSCARAIEGLVAKYRACVSDTAATCDVAPRLFLIGRARVGIAAMDGEIPSSCMNDPAYEDVRALQAVTDLAVRQAVEDFDPTWVMLVDRLATLTTVYDSLAEICEPRRRRFTPADLGVARERLTQIGAALARRETVPSGAWEYGRAQLEVPGVGPVTELARFDAGPDSTAVWVRQQAQALARFVAARARCVSEDLLDALVVGVIDVETGQFRGGERLFAEQLVCADLGPALAGRTTAQ